MGRSKKMSNPVKYTGLLVLFLFLLLIRFSGIIGPDQSPNERFRVIKIIDGDTVELAGGDQLRLLAIDTPEDGEQFHAEATRFLEEQALGRLATIVYENRRRDRYGRLLGYLYIDSIFINEQILKNGLGYLYLFKDTQKGSMQIIKLFAAQKQAIKNSNGLYSIMRESEPLYLATRNSFRFHRPNCNSIRNSDPIKMRQFSNREESLLEGLSPCRNCKP